MELTVERALTEARRLARGGKLTAAEAVLGQALRRYPRNARLRRAAQGLGAPAKGAAETVAGLLAAGEAWWQDGRTDRARPYFEAALERAPRDLAAQLGAAHVARAEGRTAEAVARYTALIAQEPTLADPYRYITDMRHTRPGDGWIETLTNALQVAQAEDARVSLGFALGKALNDIGALDASFAAYSLANKIRAAQLGRAPLDRIAELQALAAAFAAPDDPPAMDLDLKPWGDTPRPIFILGLPRSGSTLIERVLAQHSQVAAGGERRDLTDAINAVGGALKRPDTRMASAIREAYRISLRAASGSGDAGFVTDKMPSNARWLPHIRACLPEAIVIEPRRDPVAVGWSHFRRLFDAEQLAYSFDLTHIAAYIEAHERMMAQWRAQAPGEIRAVCYEALTAQPEAEIPALLADIGLPFEPACLAPQAHGGAVRTASFEQVRQPIYAGSSDGWRGYAQHLGPLLRLQEMARAAA